MCLFPRSHGGTGRGAAVVRAAAGKHSALPSLCREVTAPRARTASAKPGYRIPLLSITHETYDDYVSLSAHDGKR